MASLKWPLGLLLSKAGHGIFNYQKLDMAPLKWPLGLLLSKAGQGMFYVRNDLSECCTQQARRILTSLHVLARDN